MIYKMKTQFNGSLPLKIEFENLAQTRIPQIVNVIESLKLLEINSIRTRLALINITVDLLIMLRDRERPVTIP